MNKNTASKGLIAVIAVVIVIIVIVLIPKKEEESGFVMTSTDGVAVGTKETTDTAVAPVGTTDTGIASVSTEPVVGASSYADGSYTATGTYKSPAGTESVKVALTIKDGIVTDSSVEGVTDNNTSKRYQAMFVGGYKQYVIGKSIDAITLDKVSGSSLTPKGFNDAVARIKTEAKA